MTREEAIRHGKEQLEIFGEGCEHYEFIKMALQALSQEPCDDATLKDIFCMGCEYREQEPCDDAISRQAVLDGLRGCICDEWVKTLFATMVKQLPSVNPQPCDDAISREMALNSLIDNTHLDGYDLAEALDAIENKEKLPPVTPQSKTGHWIHFAQSDDCSECGWSTGKYISPSKYCPNCGCRMVEPQERSDKE